MLVLSSLVHSNFWNWSSKFNDLVVFNWNLETWRMTINCLKLSFWFCRYANIWLVRLLVHTVADVSLDTHYNIFLFNCTNNRREWLTILQTRKWTWPFTHYDSMDRIPYLHICRNRSISFDISNGPSDKIKFTSKTISVW